MTWFCIAVKKPSVSANKSALIIIIIVIVVLIIVVVIVIWNYKMCHGKVGLASNAWDSHSKCL
jgi:cytochrome bd-type quinol oxidase subunit 2